MPSRIQRQRTKGWRTPLCSCGCGRKAIYVGRGSKWGNPWVVTGNLIKDADHDHLIAFDSHDEALRHAVSWYAEAIPNGWESVPMLKDIRAELAGHDLMCWCPAGQPCHADVLLDIANEEAR